MSSGGRWCILRIERHIARPEVLQVGNVVEHKHVAIHEESPALVVACEAPEPPFESRGLQIVRSRHINPSSWSSMSGVTETGALARA